MCLLRMHAPRGEIASFHRRAQLATTKLTLHDAVWLAQSFFLALPDSTMSLLPFSTCMPEGSRGRRLAADFDTRQIRASCDPLPWLSAGPFAFIAISPLATKVLVVRTYEALRRPTSICRILPPLDSSQIVSKVRVQCSENSAREISRLVI